MLTLAATALLVAELNGLPSALTSLEQWRTDSAHVLRTGGAFAAQPSTVSEPAPTQGTIAQLGRGFGGDWYYRIHVTPLSLPLGNLVSAQQRTVEVWNAYPDRALTLLGAPLSGGEGITVTAPGAMPLQFAPLQPRIWQVSVSTDGPPVIAATLTFEFADFLPIPVPITGQRVTAFAFEPDWGSEVVERLQWLTDVMVSASRARQARALRIAPRRSFEFTVLVEGEERTLLDLSMLGWGGRVWALPVPQDVQSLQAPVPLGALSIGCDPAGRDFRDGGLALLRGPTAFDYEVVEVESAQPSQLLLARPTLNAWARGARLSPVRTARLSEPPKLRRITDRLVSLNVRFDTVEPCDWPAVLPGTLYRGYPVLEQVPDETEDLTLTWMRVLETLDNRTGTPSITEPANWASTVQGHRWVLHGRQQQGALRSLLYGLRGRQRAVWVPTHADDVRLAAPVSAGATTLEVRRTGLAGFGLMPGRRDLRIALRSGEILRRRILSAVGIDAHTERLQLDDALPAIALAGTRRISFMALMTLQSDEAVLRHVTDSDGVATCSVAFEGVRDEVEDATA